MESNAAATVEQRTGELYGGLWVRYDDKLFKDSVALFEKRWSANGEPADFFVGKRCLDVGCGGGRYSIAMSMMGAESVVGVDVSETGIQDAARRAEALGMAAVSFRQATALQLPFADAEFDFVCCSGVLHHTASVERGMAEIYRVLKPGGSVYLLLYGAGGLFWTSNYVMRAFAKLAGHDEMEHCVEQAGYAVNRRRAVLDDLFVPILETYPEERVDRMLGNTGFREWRRWKTGNMDHENNPSSMLDELESRALLWQAGCRTSTDPVGALAEKHAAAVIEAVIASVRGLIAAEQRGTISMEQLREAVIGHGHHRLIAVK